MIESKDNLKYKYWMKLKLKKYRDAENKFLIYGSQMIEFAKKHDLIEELITSHPAKKGTLITKNLMKNLSQTETTFDQMAVCRKFSHQLKSQRILVLDDVQNPDNVGALIRSALAFGFKHIVLSKGSADLYNDKTIRASSGAIFECMIERMDLVPFIKKRKEAGYQIFGADAHTSVNQPNQMKPFILVMGNEGNGLSENIKPLLDGTVHIQTKDIESLNVAVAGSILMYEWKGLK